MRVRRCFLGKQRAHATHDGLDLCTLQAGAPLLTQYSPIRRGTRAVEAAASPAKTAQKSQGGETPPSLVVLAQTWIAPSVIRKYLGWQPVSVRVIYTDVRPFGRVGKPTTVGFPGPGAMARVVPRHRQLPGFQTLRRTLSRKSATKQPEVAQLALLYTMYNRA